MRSLILCILLFSAIPLHAQWQWGNPQPQGNDLWNVDFAPSSATGWAVGAAGMIVKSTNGGATWFTQESGHEDFLRGIEAVDALTAWVVGDNGVVLKTTNGGNSWMQQNSGTTAGINTVFALSATTAWFVGDAGMLRSTTNGGMTWLTQNSGTINNLNSVHFVSATNGVAVGSDGTIVRSTNGGSSWALVPLPGGPGPGFSAHLLDVFFADASYGWTCGAGGALYTTVNGGANWSRIMNNGMTADINRVRFTSRTEGWAVGESGALHRSTTGGQSWSTLTSGTVNGLEGLALSGGNVVAVGLFGDILRSTNGTAFTMMTGGPRSTVNAVCAAVPSSAWAVGSDGLIMRTTNGGVNWTQLNSGTTTALFGVDDINGQTVIACGNGGLILRSTNGGDTWSTIASGTTVALNGVDLLPGGIGYIVGASGRLLKTTNAGAGWYPVASGTLQSLFGVDFTDANNGTVVGADGTAIGTTNGGYTWFVQQPWTLDALFHVVREGHLGMLCGDGGTAAVTTDGGQSWTSVYPPTTEPLFHLVHPAPNEFAAVGANGVIMRTSDYGQTWVREISHAQNTLYGADAHGGNVYAVGDYGMALRNGSYPFPVELLSFSAFPDGACIGLRWETEAEENLHGFAVERLETGDWLECGFVFAGSTTHGFYEFRDCPASAELHTYRLRMMDVDGRVEYSPEVSFGTGSYTLPEYVDVYPQPSRGNVSIRFDLSTPLRRLTLSDISGKVLQEWLPVPEITGGTHLVSAAAFPAPGLYIVSLATDSRVIRRKVLILE
ncbi:MAG: T9SS type A sorting domain-containing protein [Bacteroidetes bacterium]|nr:T9SS type A sorting domain-containing protein [Bacteroidota bacterium]